LGGAIRWHGHPVLGFADVDPGGMGVVQREWERAHRGLRDRWWGRTGLREGIFIGGHGSLQPCKERRQERRGGRREEATCRLPNGIRPRPVASDVVATS
jgi:hypothetical protein